MIVHYGHAVGTCRLGASNDPEAVADSDGLVRGTTNVRVADASFMPVIPVANTNLTAMLIGWRWLKRSTQHPTSLALLSGRDGRSHVRGAPAACR